MQSFRSAIVIGIWGLVALLSCLPAVRAAEYTSLEQAGFIEGDPLPVEGFPENFPCGCTDGTFDWTRNGLYWYGPHHNFGDYGYRCSFGEFPGYLPVLYGSAEAVAMFRDVRHPTSDPVPAPVFTGNFDAGVMLTLGAQLTTNYRLEGSYTGPFEWNGATTVGPNLATFQSKMNSGELSLRHRLRMPPGPYETSVLLGLRLTDIEDQLIYLGQTTVTNNELLGLQAGVMGQFAVHNRCWLDWEIKGAINNNRVSAGAIPATDATAFLGETSLILNYQFLPSMTLRGGYRGMWLTGLAVAEENVNNPLIIDHSGEIVYHGLNLGITWTR